ncbi:MAG: DciA family protein [Candidatus Moraniibacteriota bacterium]
MRSLKEFIGERGGEPKETLLDDKTVFFIFRKIIREEYGLRGSLELEPTAFGDGVLSVKANNPLYSNELWIHRVSILERVNTALEKEAVTELRLVRYTP